MSINNSVVVYDIEIKNLIPDRDGRIEINPKTGQPYQYCDGWHDHAGMGIGVLAAWDCLGKVASFYDESNLDEFAKLIEQRELVTGFNIVKFDNRVLAAHGIEIPSYKVFDPYRETLIAKGFDPDDESRRPPSGRKLDDFASVNFGIRKLENGADAPKLYQQGKFLRVLNYCHHDTMLELRVFERARRNQLIDPLTREVVRLNVPEAFRIEE